jgi:hypothetical protein
MSSSTVDLLFRMKADGSQAVSEVSSLRATVTKEIAAIKANTEKGFDSSTLVSFGKSVANIASQFINTGQAVLGFVMTIAKLNAAMFEMVTKIADAEGKIFDLSTQTGVSTEAISALKFAVDESGGSIELMAQGIDKFAKTVGEAAKGSDEAKEKLRRLGIDPKEAINNLEGALAQVFKRINDAPPGITRTNLAIDAFGKTGDKLIPTIRSFNGDMAELTKTASEFGAVLSGDAAARADEFGDTLHRLDVQMQGVQRQIAHQLMPMMIAEMKEFSEEVKENRNQAINLARSYYNLADAISVVRASMPGGGGIEFKTPVELATNAAQSVLPAERAADDSLSGEDSPAEQIKRLAADAQRAAAEQLKDLKAAAEARLEVSKVELSKAQRIYNEKLEAAKADYENHLISQQEYVRRATALENSLFEARKTAIERERAELGIQEEDERKRAAQSLALDEQINQAKAERNKRVRDYAAQVKKDTETANKELEAEAKRHFDAMAQAADISLQTAIVRNRDLAEQGKITFIEAEQAVHKLIADSYAERRAALQAAIDAEAAGSKRRAELVDELGILSAKAADFVEDSERRKREAIKKTRELEDISTPKAKAYSSTGRINTQPADSEVSGAEIFKSGQGSDEGFLYGAGKTTDYSEKKSKEISQHWKNAFGEIQQMGEGAMSALGDAIGQMVQNWVLLGGASETNMRKAVASVLAGVAAQAASLAVFHFAIGLVALTPWGAALYGNAAQWFLSSAMMGTIAAGMAAGGRLVAGNAFSHDQQQREAVGSTSNGEEMRRTFNYGGQNFSSSQASAEGSRSPGIWGGVKDILNEVKTALNYNTQVMSRIDSIPGGDLIRANPYAVGDAAQEAIQSSHPIRRDITSLGSTGLA